VGPFGIILELFQCFWQRKQNFMQETYLPDGMKPFQTDYIHPHDSLLIDNHLRQLPVPAGNVQSTSCE
jgi:hypothetical protein